MAGNAVIGALRFVLGADSAALEMGLKNAESTLSRFGVNAGRMMAAAGAAMAAGLTGAAYAVKKQIDAFDDLSKTSQKIGVPVEQLTALRYAAQLSDVSAETLTKALGKLARTTVDAAQGSTMAVAAYQSLGLSFRDANGQVKPMGDLLPQIADRFAAMEDGTKKTALAMQLFGRAGADLIPLLNSGGAGLREMTAEAAAFGLVIDQNTARAAEQFNDNLTRLSSIFSGLVTQVTAQMLPTLLQFNAVLLDFARNGDLVKTATNGIVTVFKFLTAEGIKAAVTFQRLGADLYAFANVVDKFFGADFGALKKAWGEFNQSRDETAKAFENMGKTIAKFNEDATANFESLGEQTKKTFNPTIIKTTSDALESFIAKMQKATAAAQAEFNAVGQSNVVMQQAKLVAEALAAAKEKNIAVTARLRGEIEAWALSQAIANEKANTAKSVFEQTRTPAEQFALTMERLNLAFDYGKTNSDLYARGVAQAQQQLVQATPAAQALGSAMENAFDKAIDGGVKFKDILRSLLQDLAKALANQAFRAFLYGGQGGKSSGILGSMFGGGGGLLGGLFGFANGGSFQVGGSGGIDSQLVAFKASPNERVTVSKPGQGAGGGMTFVYSPQIDARGADAAAVARLAASQERDRRDFSRNVLQVVTQARANTPGIFK